jgi:C2 domain
LPRDGEGGFVRRISNDVVVTHVTRCASAPNTTHPNWGYRFYVNLKNLRASGIDLDVLDEDGEGEDGERIGSANIPRAELQRVAREGQVVNLTTGGDEIATLHIRLEPVPAGVDAAAMPFELPLEDGLTVTAVQVPQGAIVTVRASGEGQIGNGGGCGPDVTPEGLEDGECTNWNLGYATLQEAPHGSAFAMVGTGEAFEAFSLAQASVRDDGHPGCAQFIASTSGPLTLGINDRDLGNNSGAFHFDVIVTPPAGSPVSCPETTPSGSHARALNGSRPL